MQKNNEYAIFLKITLWPENQELSVYIIRIILAYVAIYRVLSTKLPDLHKQTRYSYGWVLYFYFYCRSLYPQNNDPFLLSNLLIQYTYMYMWCEHLRAIGITERINGRVDIDGRRKENLDSRGLSSAYKASSDETRGEIFEESAKKNQEQGM